MEFRRCQGCGVEKVVSEFVHPNGRRPSTNCRSCRDAVALDDRMMPPDELAELEAKTVLTPEEADAVQRGFEAMKAYMESRGSVRHGVKNGERSYTGPSAWEIIEGVTTDSRRFHRLCALVTLRYRAWVYDHPDMVRRPGNGQPYPPEVAERVVELYEHYTMTAIAARLGIEHQTVYGMLKSAGVWKPKPRKAAA